MSVMHRLRVPRSLTAVLVLLMALALVLSGVAIAQTGEKAAEEDGRGFTTAEWRGSSTGFGMVVKSDDLDYSTTSTSWSDVPGMTVRYNVNPSAPKDQSVLIAYTDEHICRQNPAASVYCYVRVLVDGIEATPENVILDSVQHSANDTSGIPYGTHTVQFVAGPLGPGPHFITVQWRVDEANAELYSNSRTISVMGFYHNLVNVLNP